MFVGRFKSKVTMVDLHSPLSVVVVTDFTTVHPTYSVVIVTDYTTVYPTNVPKPTNAPHTSLASTITSQIIPAGSSASASPPISSAQPDMTGEPKFDDTFAYVVLILVMLVTALLLTMLISMVFLRWRGKCPDCQRMREQLEKWESGEQKPITPVVVKQREAFNKSLSQSTAPAELDLERGDTGKASHAFPAAFSKPPIWKQIKRKPLPNAETSSVVEGTIYCGLDDAFRVQSNPPQIYYEPSDTYTPSAYRDSASWPYSQSAENQYTDGCGSRVFADIPISPPNRYAAYVTDEDGLNYPDIREQEILEAEGAIQSDEYKRAETIMKRASAPDSVIRRATSIVNLADQRLNIARNPSMYSEFRRLDETEYRRNGPEEYQTIEWRRKGNKPPRPDDELYLEC